MLEYVHRVWAERVLGKDVEEGVLTQSAERNDTAIRGDFPPMRGKSRSGVRVDRDHADHLRSAMDAARRAADFEMSTGESPRHLSIRNESTGVRGQRQRMCGGAAPKEHREAGQYRRSEPNHSLRTLRGGVLDFKPSGEPSRCRQTRLETRRPDFGESRGSDAASGAPTAPCVGACGPRGEPRARGSRTSGGLRTRSGQRRRGRALSAPSRRSSRPRGCRSRA